MKEARGLSASDLIYCVVAPQENCSIQKQSVCEKFNRMFSILEERQKVRVQPSSVMLGLLMINVCCFLFYFGSPVLLVLCLQSDFLPCGGVCCVSLCLLSLITLSVSA